MDVRTPSVPLWLQNLVGDLGRRTEPLPPTLEDWPHPDAIITAPVNAWEPISGSKDVSFGELSRPLECVAHFSAISDGTTGAYSMIGVNVTGELTELPEFTAGTTSPFSTTPFSVTPGSISGFKKFVLPIGTSTFRISARRNGNVARYTNYAHLLVTPVRWAD